MIDLTTVRETRKAIRECSEVLVQPRFGCSEAWVKIRKADAMFLMKPISDADLGEMYNGVFGQIDNGVLYLG